MKKLIIVGAGGHGIVCSDIAKKSSEWESIEFIDDKLEGHFINGFKVIGNINTISKSWSNYSFFIAIGDNKKRREISELISSFDLNIITLIDNSAIVSSMCKIDIGTVIMPGAIINVNTKIGKGCIINTGTILDHDNMIGDYAHISPGVNCAGNVVIGNCTWIGIGSTIINNISISSNCIVGAGSLIVKDIYEEGKYYGVPAKRIEQ